MFKVRFMYGQFGAHFKAIVKVGIWVITLTIGAISEIYLMGHGEPPTGVPDVGGKITPLTIIAVKGDRTSHDAKFV